MGKAFYFYLLFITLLNNQKISTCAVAIQRFVCMSFMAMQTGRWISNPLPNEQNADAQADAGAPKRGFCEYGHKYHGNDALLYYQENYAACLIESITQKPAHTMQKITWEEFEYSDFLAIPEKLIQASLAHP